MGCSSYKADVVTICDAEAASRVDQGAELTGGAREKFISDWVSRNLHSPEGEALMAALLADGNARSARGARLHDEAVKQGLARCPMAEHWALPSPEVAR